MDLVIPAFSISPREYFPLVLNGIHLKGKGVEVGVQKGIFSEIILKSWEGQTLYSIDPWLEFSKDEYIDDANVPQNKQEELYQETLERLKPFGNQSKVIRAKSEEAVKLFQDEQLDFVYLDAQHTYEALKKDIERWFPKVKKGGLLGGHDYIDDGIYAEGVYGVMSAVNEFVRKEKLDLILSNELRSPSWFVLKK